MSFSSDPAAYPPAGRPATNPAGRASLIAGAVVVLLTLVHQIAFMFLPVLTNALGLDYAGIGMVSGIASLAFGVLALVPLLLGIVGLTRPGLPKGAAGAGTAIGATTLVGVLVGIIAAPIASLLI